MKRTLLLITIALLVVLSVPAHARKACDELKQEIAAKIDAKGVKAYTLDVVALDGEVQGRVVGTCNGGTQRVVYLRTDKVATSATVAKAD